MKPFTFKDGTHIRAEDWVCVPQRSLLRDPAIYPRPATFDPYRFLSHNSNALPSEAFPHDLFPTLHNHDSQKPSRFTDLSPDYPIWGLGKQAWCVFPTLATLCDANLSANNISHSPGRFYASFIIKLVLVEMLQNYDLKMDAIPEKRYFTWRSSLIPRPNLQFEVRAK